MEKHIPEYSLGDMIVHRFYGVGQIKCIETRLINGVNTECFNVETNNGNFWFPIDSYDNPRIHPVASQAIITKAIEIFRSSPQGLEDDQLQWKERIGDAQKNGDFLTICSIVRDLFALKSQKKLNRTQEQGLSNLEDRLLTEWAASLGVDTSSILKKIQGYLRENDGKL